MGLLGVFSNEFQPAANPACLAIDLPGQAGNPKLRLIHQAEHFKQKAKLKESNT
jgi:hypothetical protein